MSVISPVIHHKTKSKLSAFGLLSSDTKFILSMLIFFHLWFLTYEFSKSNEKNNWVGSSLSLSLSSNIIALKIHNIVIAFFNFRKMFAWQSSQLNSYTGTFLFLNFIECSWTYRLHNMVWCFYYGNVDANLIDSKIRRQSILLSAPNRNGSTMHFEGVEWKYNFIIWWIFDFVYPQSGFDKIHCSLCNSVHDMHIPGVQVSDVNNSSSSSNIIIRLLTLCIWL